MQDDEIILDENRKPYPSIGESFLIVLITLLFSIPAIPLYFFKDKLGDGLTSLLTYLIVMVPPVLIFSSVKRKAEGKFRFSFMLPGILIVVVGVLVNWAISLGISAPIDSLFPNSWIKYYIELLGNPGILTIVSFVIAAPILEEMLFRGIILDGLLKRYSPRTSIIVSALLFGLTHLNPVQFVAAFLSGLFFGWVYYRTRSVGFTMILHFTMNILGSLGMLLESDPTTSLDKGYFQSFGGVAWFVVLVVVSITVIIIGLRYLDNKLPRSLGKGEEKGDIAS